MPGFVFFSQQIPYPAKHLIPVALLTARIYTNLWAVTVYIALPFLFLSLSEIRAFFAVAFVADFATGFATDFAVDFEAGFDLAVVLRATLGVGFAADFPMPFEVLFVVDFAAGVAVAF